MIIWGARIIVKLVKLAELVLNLKIQNLENKNLNILLF